MEEKAKLVVTDFYNFYRKSYAVLHRIVPLACVNYKLISRHNAPNCIRNGFKNQGLVAIYLSAPRRRFVAISLSLQGFSPCEFIEAVTVHGPWKILKWQGYVFALQGSEKTVCLGSSFASRHVHDITPYIRQALAIRNGCFLV